MTWSSKTKNNLCKKRLRTGFLGETSGQERSRKNVQDRKEKRRIVAMSNQLNNSRKIGGGCRQWEAAQDLPVAASGKANQH